MEEYFSQKYANILDAEDILELFENVKDVYGSIQKAAEKCDVARTTPYGWEKANYVKTITKRKVLKASLEANLIETLNVLTNKSKDRTEDLLLTYMTSIYQKAIDTNQPKFEHILDRFLVARQEHYGLIRDALQDEVTLMTQTLAEKAMELQITLPQDPIENIEPAHMLEIIPDIVMDLAVKRVDLLEIANRYGVPIEIPFTIKNALDPVISSSTILSAQPTTDDWYKYRQMYKPAGMFENFLEENPLNTQSPEDFKLIPIAS